MSSASCRKPTCISPFFPFWQPRAEQGYPRSPDFTKSYFHLQNRPITRLWIVAIGCPTDLIVGDCGVECFQAGCYFINPILNGSPESIVSLQGPNWMKRFCSVVWKDRQVVILPLFNVLQTPFMFNGRIGMASPRIQKLTLLSTDIEVLGPIEPGWIILTFC